MICCLDLQSTSNLKLQNCVTQSTRVHCLLLISLTEVNNEAIRLMNVRRNSFFGTRLHPWYEFVIILSSFVSDAGCYSSQKNLTLQMNLVSGDSDADFIAAWTLIDWVLSFGNFPWLLKLEEWEEYKAVCVKWRKHETQNSVLLVPSYYE